MHTVVSRRPSRRWVLCWCTLLLIALAQCSTRPSSPATKIVAISNHTCAVFEDGTVWCWGDNLFGNLGFGGGRDDINPHPYPIPVGGVQDAVDVVGGFSHTCALIGDGTVRCWGAADQFGDGERSGYRTPDTVPGLHSVTQLAAHDSRSCAVLQDGSARCWGYGLIGDGTSQDRFAHTAIALDEVQEISVGFRHVCAIRRDGSLWCWGRNFSGEIGDGTTMERLLPTRVVGIDRAIRVVTGIGYSCALLPDATVRCWGSAFLGTLGNGASFGQEVLPIVVEGLDGVAELTGGNGQVCALMMDRTIQCWGQNGAGQAGVAGPSAVTRPTVVAGLSDVVNVSAGGAHTCALVASGEMYCWGENLDGQLGDGTHGASVHPTPTRVEF